MARTAHQSVICLLLLAGSAMAVCQPTVEVCAQVVEPAKPQPEAGPAKASPMSITTESFGTTPEGAEVHRYSMTNANGLKLSLIDYGAAIQSIQVPDREGKLAEIQLNFADLAGYLKHKAHFGCTIGRFGNRIAKGKFTLDGEEYSLPINNGPNSLHGGPNGFDRVVWQAEPFEQATGRGVKFSYTSPDGEAGYPGNLTVRVTYTLTDANELRIDYAATTDKATVLNLTNHTYWNLGGTNSGDVLGYQLQLHADKYLAVDATLIPTGELVAVKGGAMDFTKAKAIGKDIAELKDESKGMRGYDHCYVVDGKPGTLRPAAKAHDPQSGRVMEIFTTEPAIQFYTSNFLDGGEVNGGYEQHSALCLETQHYPDSPNQPSFPSTVLRPGEKFESTTVHKFSVE